MAAHDAVKPGRRRAQQRRGDLTAQEPGHAGQQDLRRPARRGAARRAQTIGEARVLVQRPATSWWTDLTRKCTHLHLSTRWFSKACANPIVARRRPIYAVSRTICAASNE